MKSPIFWDVTSYGSCKNRRFGGTYRLHHQSHKNQRARNSVVRSYQPKHAAKKYYHHSTYNIAFLRNVLRLLVDSNVPISTILFTPMTEGIQSSETSVLTRTTQLNIPEDGILLSHRRDNLKSYMFLGFIG
jgi:hypothetical protein